MASNLTRIEINAKVSGVENVEALKNAVKRLQSTASPAATDIDRLKQAAVQLGSATDRTENDLRTAVTVLKDLRANVALNDAEFRKLTASINRYESQLNKATGATGRFSKAGQTLGAVAASGVFGGPEGAIGATIGGIVAGPAGALTGGAIGAQASILRQQAGDTAAYAAQISKLNLALRELVGTQQEYIIAQNAIKRAVDDFNVPIGETTKGFTRLSASVIGAGGNVSDAERVFRGVSAAVKATGGSAEDVQAALTAMAQVFGKGKVSAEELQGQLGERLPGAVTKFAQATGRSLPQLAKDLQDGTVGLNDLMKFVDALEKQYSSSALKIADSQDEAGARMQVSLDKLRQALGETFKPIGAELQNSIADLADAAVRELGRTVDVLKEVRTWLDPFIGKLVETKNAISNLQNIFPQFFSDLQKQILTFMPVLAPVIAQMNAVVWLRNKIFGAQNQNAQESGMYGRYGAPDTQVPYAQAPTKFANPAGDGAAKAAADRAAKKAAQEAERALNDYNRALEKSGDLLKNVIRKSEDVESATRAIGASAFDALYLEFQESGTQAKRTIEDLNKSLSELSKARAEAISKGVNTENLDARITRITNAISYLKTVLGDQSSREFTQGISDLLGEEVQSVDAAVEAYYNLAEAKQANVEVVKGLKDAVGAYIEQLGTLRDAVAGVATNAFRGLEDAIVELVTTGRTNFRAFVADILKQTARMILQQFVFLQIVKAVQSALGGGGGFFGGGGGSASSFNFSPELMTGMTGGPLFAKGGAFAQNGIVPFATGGIVDRPTLFKFANGTGLMGEAGPEAIIPLKRGRDGKLGVAGGGTGTSVVVNVDAKGTSVQGDSTQGAALGRVIAGAVQAELIKQKRPGGLLAA